MLRIIIFSSFLAPFLDLGCEQQKESTLKETQHEMAVEKSEQIYYYTCPMEKHKHVYNDRFGECPECRMNLVAAVEAAPDSADYYGCPMISHSHIRHSEAGKCEECNMDLKPMRLKTGP